MIHTLLVLGIALLVLSPAIACGIFIVHSKRGKLPPNQFVVEVVRKGPGRMSVQFFRPALNEDGTSKDGKNMKAWAFLNEVLAAGTINLPDRIKDELRAERDAAAKMQEPREVSKEVRLHHKIPEAPGEVFRKRPGQNGGPQ